MNSNSGLPLAGQKDKEEEELINVSKMGQACLEKDLQELE